MALYTASRSLVSTPTFAAVAAVAGTAVRRLWTTLKNRRAVSGLSAYDDRMLKDIGLVRSDIDAALDCPLDQDPSVHLTRVAAGRGRPKF